MAEHTKICIHCKNPIAINDFEIASSRISKKTGNILTYTRNVCRPCRNARVRNHRAKNLEKARERDRRSFRRYSMSKADYDRKNEAQGNRCSICGGDNGGRRLCVDHDHACCKGMRSCGKCVRGLLCIKCNHALHFIENKEFLIAAEIYLWQHSKEGSEISVS